MHSCAVKIQRVGCSGRMQNAELCGRDYSGPAVQRQKSAGGMQSQEMRPVRVAKAGACRVSRQGRCLGDLGGSDAGCGLFVTSMAAEERWLDSRLTH
eukprot:1350230-Prymnesium_polylepis.1